MVTSPGCDHSHATIPNSVILFYPKNPNELKFNVQYLICVYQIHSFAPLNYNLLEVQLICVFCDEYILAYVCV